MSAPQSPIANLLAWLTVSVFLFSGAPAPRATAGSQDNPQRIVAANGLAKSFAALDLAQRQLSSSQPLLKPWDWMDAPSCSHFAGQSLSLSRDLKPCRVAPACARRLSLVGIVELRV